MMIALEMLRSLDSELLLERSELLPAAHRAGRTDDAQPLALSALVGQIVALWLCVGAVTYWLF